MNKGNFAIQLVLNVFIWVLFFLANNIVFREIIVSFGVMGGSNGLPVLYAVFLFPIFIFVIFDIYKIVFTWDMKKYLIGGLILNLITLLFFGLVFTLSYSSPVI